MSKPITGRDVVLALEPNILDAHVASMVAMTVWDAVGQKRPADGALILTEDEAEQMQRVLNDVHEQVCGVKTAYSEMEAATAAGGKS